MLWSWWAFTQSQHTRRSYCCDVRTEKFGSQRDFSFCSHEMESCLNSAYVKLLIKFVEQYIIKKEVSTKCVINFLMYRFKFFTLWTFSTCFMLYKFGFLFEFFNFFKAVLKSLENKLKLLIPFWTQIKRN